MMTSRDIARESLLEDAQARTIAQSAEAHDHTDQDGHDHSFEWTEIVRIAFVAIASAAVWFRIWEPLQSVSVIGVVGLLVGGWPIFKEAFENLISRRMTMELSMTNCHRCSCCDR